MSLRQTIAKAPNMFFLHNVVNKCTAKSKVIPYKDKSDVFMTAKTKFIFTKNNRLKRIKQVVTIGRLT